jgi:hypothetical protein
MENPSITTILPVFPLPWTSKSSPMANCVTLAKHQRFYAHDNPYQLAGTYEAGNAYTADLHDLQILENGNSLVFIFDQRTVDMSANGGSPNAAVVDCIIQELDQQKNVLFEWNSADHIEITDTNQALDTNIIRYIHCNWSDVLPNGCF